MIEIGDRKQRLLWFEKIGILWRVAKRKIYILFALFSIEVDWMKVLLARCSLPERVRFRWQKMDNRLVIGTQGAIECNVRKREGK